MPVSRRVSEAGTMRANGVPVSPTAPVQSRTGILRAQARGDYTPDPLPNGTPSSVQCWLWRPRPLPNVGQSFKDAFSDVRFIAADNSALVEDNFNDATYSGFRIGVMKELNEDWSLNVNHMQQKRRVGWCVLHRSELDDLQVQRFEQDSIKDDFHNTNWTLEGRLSALDVLYTGAFCKRETDQRVDYTDYLFVGQYLPYYICDSSVTYPEYNYAVAALTRIRLCRQAASPKAHRLVFAMPNLFVTSVQQPKSGRMFRVQTDQDMRLRGLAGVFSQTELKERVDFTYPGSEMPIFSRILSRMRPLRPWRVSTRMVISRPSIINPARRLCRAVPFSAMMFCGQMTNSACLVKPVMTLCRTH